MKTYKISVGIFYDKKNILLQDRKDFTIRRFEGRIWFLWRKNKTRRDS